jgi:hypothetical protein
MRHVSHSDSAADLYKPRTGGSSKIRVGYEESSRVPRINVNSPVRTNLMLDRKG